MDNTNSTSRSNHPRAVRLPRLAQRFRLRLLRLLRLLAPRVGSAPKAKNERKDEHIERSIMVVACLRMDA